MPVNITLVNWVLATQKLVQLFGFKSVDFGNTFKNEMVSVLNGEAPMMNCICHIQRTSKQKQNVKQCALIQRKNRP